MLSKATACQGSNSQVLIFAFPMQVADSPVASRTDGVAELKWLLDVADADIALVNKRLDESQGMQFLCGHLVRELDAYALQHVCLM